MNWTDERVELLKKLWGEGLSASQIAAELGGVSRNAVIGKVHRLKLSGRGKTTKPAPRIRKTVQSPARSLPVRDSEDHDALPSSVVSAHEINAAKADLIPDSFSDSMANVVVPMARHLTLLQLSENTCKWPVGDPLSDEFYFCGADAGEGTPYCSFHSKLAFQPISERRRRAS